MPIYDLGEVSPQTPADDSHWIAPNATVIGNVHLQADVSIWFGAVLRGDGDRIEIGAGSNIQDGTVLHVDPGFPIAMGAGVSVGHAAIIHGCTIGEGSLIGMGATVMNGAVIGPRSIVGANALVPAGKVFPERSMILGAPARLVRELTDEEVARIAGTARGYVERIRRYRAELRLRG